MASPEYKTMVECTQKLVTGIAKGPEDIADALFSKGLIAEGVKREMSLSLIAADKARRLVENITSEVKEYPKETFPTFLEILRNFGWLDKLVKALEDTFAKHGQPCARLPLPQQQQQQPVQQPRSSQPDADRELNSDDHLMVVKAVASRSANWQELAEELGLPRNTIRSIAGENNSNRLCLSHALSEWLHKNYKYETHGVPSWRRLAEAIRPIDRGLSIEIEGAHGIR